MRNIRVVFSIDFTITFVFGVMGACASLKGLKLRTAFRIRVDVEGRARTRIDRVLRVASTIKTSLRLVLLANCTILVLGTTKGTHLLLSCNTPSILSNNPKASASSVGVCSTGWLGGTMTREISSGSPRYKNGQRHSGRHRLEQLILPLVLG